MSAAYFQTVQENNEYIHRERKTKWKGKWDKIIWEKIWEFIRLSLQLTLLVILKAYKNQITQETNRKKERKWIYFSKAKVV